MPEMTTLRRRPGGRASANAGEPVYRLDIMTQADVPDVSRVERRCFANPWPASAYRRELQNPAQNYYVVLREMRAGSLGGSGRTIGPSDGRRCAKRNAAPRARAPALAAANRTRSAAGQRMGECIVPDHRFRRNVAGL